MVQGTVLSLHEFLKSSACLLSAGQRHAEEKNILCSSLPLCEGPDLGYAYLGGGPRRHNRRLRLKDVDVYTLIPDSAKDSSFVQVGARSAMNSNRPWIPSQRPAYFPGTFPETGGTM